MKQRAVLSRAEKYYAVQSRTAQSKAEQSREVQSKQSKADIWVGIMHVCLWLHLPRQDCKLCLRFSDGCNWKWLKLHSVLLLLTSLLCKRSSTRQVLLTSLLCKTVQDRFLFVRLCVRKKTFLGKSHFLPFWHFLPLDQTTWYRRTPVQMPSWFSAQRQDEKTRPKAPSDQMYLRTRICFIKSFF